MASLGEQLDHLFAEFEHNERWHLSLPAKVIIQQTLISVSRDTLGMGDYGRNHPEAVRRAFETLPQFLKTLREKAEAEPSHTIASREIGGIFVLQHMKSWAGAFGCLCWPI
jgi:hypothetical protein